MEWGAEGGTLTPTQEPPPLLEEKGHTKLNVAGGQRARALLLASTSSRLEQCREGLAAFAGATSGLILEMWCSKIVTVQSLKCPGVR